MVRRRDYSEGFCLDPLITITGDHRDMNVVPGSVRRLNHGRPWKSPFSTAWRIGNDTSSMASESSTEGDHRFAILKTASLKRPAVTADAGRE
jgi:hypothetical protein